MSKKNISYKSKQPKIKNIFLYLYRCFIKLIATLYFVLGAVFIALFVFPFIRLFTMHKQDFGIIARAYVSHTFRIFLRSLGFLQIVELKVEDRQACRNVRGKVIVANHPSLLDFVCLMSLFPNSTCIVRGSLTRTPLRGVIKQAYITNTTDFEDVLAETKRLIDKGCNVIVFPEGTRSPRIGQNNYKKGAARIALYCNCNVLPLFIGGSDKYGLGKHDLYTTYNHVEKYLYDIKMLPEIDVNQFKDLSEPIAAKHFTEEMEKVIRGAGEEYAKTYTGLTLNNF